MKGRLTATLGCAALGAALAAPTADARDRHRHRLVEVTITNITRGQILSPPVVVTHRRGLEPIFQLGGPASAELAALAEDAVADGLIDALAVDRAAKDVEIAAGPVPPGESVTLTLQAPRHGARVSALAMLVTTNDAFFAVRDLRVPWRGGRGATAHAYDAGSEANNELCEFIPGPPCNNAGVRQMEGAEGFVHIHAGIHGVGNLEPADFDWRDPVALVTVKRAH